MEEGDDLDKRVQRSGDFPRLSTDREISVVFLSLGHPSKIEFWTKVQDVVQ